MTPTYVTPTQIYIEAVRLAGELHLDPKTDTIYGIPRGGVPVAMMLSGMSGCRFTLDIAEANVIVDDIIDSGTTMHAARIIKRAERDDRKLTARFGALFDKRHAQWAGQWLVMPWEGGSFGSGEDIITRLLQYIGEDPKRVGLKDTPKRVLAAWKEWADGYAQDPKVILKTFTENGADEMVVVRDIPFVSKCEHHLSDIVGTAHVGYIPARGKIVGLSKLPRLVNCFAHRLQVQERMTHQIATALMVHTDALGAGVLVRATHHCMSTRGVRVHGSSTVTSVMLGVFKQPETRAEFFSLCRG